MKSCGKVKWRNEKSDGATVFFLCWQYYLLSFYLSVILNQFSVWLNIFVLMGYNDVFSSLFKYKTWKCITHIIIQFEKSNIGNNLFPLFFYNLYFNIYIIFISNLEMLQKKWDDLNNTVWREKHKIHYENSKHPNIRWPWEWFRDEFNKYLYKGSFHLIICITAQDFPIGLLNKIRWSHERFVSCFH